MMKSPQQAIEAAVAAIQDRPLTAAMASREEVTLSSTSAAESSQPDLLVQDRFKAADLANSAPSIVKKQSTATGTPDVGILSKNFLKNKGREQPVDKQFAIHRKKRAAAVDVDVGILGNGRRQQASRT